MSGKVVLIEGRMNVRNKGLLQEPEYLTPLQMAIRFDVTLVTFYRWLREGRIKGKIVEDKKDKRGGHLFSNDCTVDRTRKPGSGRKRREVQ